MVQAQTQMHASLLRLLLDNKNTFKKNPLCVCVCVCACMCTYHNYVEKEAYVIGSDATTVAGKW
jgi:hypothetical protein